MPREDGTGPFGRGTRRLGAWAPAAKASSLLELAGEWAGAEAWETAEAPAWAVGSGRGFGRGLGIGRGAPLPDQPAPSKETDED